MVPVPVCAGTLCQLVISEYIPHPDDPFITNRDNPLSKINQRSSFRHFPSIRDFPDRSDE